MVSVAMVGGYGAMTITFAGLGFASKPTTALRGSAAGFLRRRPSSVFGIAVITFGFVHLSLEARHLFMVRLRPRVGVMPYAAARKRERHGIQSVEIASRILAAMAETGQPLQLKDAARGCDISAAKAHRYPVSPTLSPSISPLSSPIGSIESGP